jgi:hypothetical protein
MAFQGVLEGKVVFNDNHAMYIVDNNGSVSEVKEDAQAKLRERGIKFCGKTKYNGRYKKEVAAMKGKPLIFMTMQEFYDAAYPKNGATLDKKPKSKSLPPGLNIMFETFVITKRQDEFKGETYAN